MRFVLIDLRDAATAEKGFIPGAIGIPAKDLASWKDRFPENKKAPIILYDAAQASLEAFKTVRGWGYVNTTVLREGIGSWKGELKTGPLAAPAKIEYVKKLKPGEITIDDVQEDRGHATRGDPDRRRARTAGGRYPDRCAPDPAESVRGAL